MKKPSHGGTAATRFLNTNGVAYTEQFYEYVEHGGTEVAAGSLGVDQHHVVKTLVMEDDTGAPLIVLMHGDKTVSTRYLARQIGVKRVQPCTPQAAQRHSGYLAGGTSPFGTRKKLRVCLERSILELERIWINGGRRGFLVCIAPREVVRTLAPALVEAALKD